MKMTTEMVTNLEGLEKLKPAWQQLFSARSSNSYFQSYEWLISWWKNYTQNESYELCIISVKSSEDDQLLLLWPLVIKRIGLVKIGIFPGQENSQYGDVLVSDQADLDDCLELAWQKLIEAKIDVLNLQQVCEGAALYPFLSSKCEVNGLTEATNYVDFKDIASWDAYMLTKSKNFRKRQKRMLRQFSELGELSFDVVEDEQLIPSVVNDLIRIKANWFKETEVYGRILEHPNAASWILETCLHAQQMGKLNLTVLRLDGQVVAGQIAFINSNKLVAYLGAYDIKYSRFGIGRLQTEQAVRWAYENGYQIFDFMPPQDEYKTNWINHNIKVDNFLYCMNIKGKVTASFLHQNFKKRLKKIYHLAPRKLQEKLTG